MRKTILATAMGAIFALSACSDNTAPKQVASAPSAVENTKVTSSNPFFQQSSLQYQAPDFTAFNDDHFLPAFEEGMKQHMAEVEVIANNPAEPTFDNTLVALEKSGYTTCGDDFYN